ncbi:MAG: hypothetical protein KC619_00760 [Myxococcales bacterium]|nr:hypothetical protein [Myxococcales bacterium]
MRALAALILALALGGCSASGFEMIVDLRSDLRPGYDFVVVRTSILEAPDPSVEGLRRTLAAATTDDYVTGERVAELPELPAGSYLIAVELLDGASTVVASRRARVDVHGPRSVSIVITSECFGVTCPGVGDPTGATECSAGRCVSPECTADNPDACGIGGCATDDDCPSIVSCSVGRCTGGACFQAPDDTLCAMGTYCDITDGCTPIPVMDAGPPPPPDAGVGTDAGSPVGTDAGFDAGPSCDPAACDDGDPCTDDLCGVGGRCVNPPRCGAGEYCEAGACWPEPSLSVTTTDGFGCADLGVDHSSSARALWRRVVTGRPGRTFTQYNQHVGCGDPATPAESHALDGSGRFEDESLSGASNDCDNAFLGRYAAYVDVDGRTSGTIEVTYFNSRCPGISTCSAARSYCPPCRDCGASEYCYASTSCAPLPTLTIATTEGGGCADLGTAHASPAFLWRRTVTGRPGATATQYNEHVSCGGPVTAADTIVLDGAGRDVASNENPVSTDCASPFLGRYRAYVEVDGETSATTEVTYFNSNCPAIATCALARTYCAP